MSNIVIRKRRGTTVELSALTPLVGELVIDVTKPTVVVGDGTTLGGIPLAKESHSHASATSMTAGFMSSSDKTKLDALSLAGGIQNILANTVAVTARTTANFNSDFTVIDNNGASRTDFAISSTFRNEITSDIIALVLALS
jgi:hypothetical protein